MPYRNKRWRENLNRALLEQMVGEVMKNGNTLNCPRLVTRNKFRRRIKSLRNSNPRTASWEKENQPILLKTRELRKATYKRNRDTSILFLYSSKNNCKM